MNDVLARIVERTREDLAREPIDLTAVESAARDVVAGVPAHRFRGALAKDGVRIIAEIKSASPSAGPIVNDPDVGAIASEYAQGGAAAISVVTEPHFFRGSRDWLRRASEASGLPVVMKDFIICREQIVRGIGSGADAVLLLASLLDAEELRGFLKVCDELGRDALVEVHDELELERAVEAGASIIGVNNRDLRTFEVTLATAERLGPKIPEQVIRVSESGIRTPADVERLRSAGYSAFLIGETLMKSDDRAGLIGELCRDQRGIGNQGSGISERESGIGDQGTESSEAALTRRASRMSTMVKICGIRRPDDALAAIDAGADFIGLVFAGGSKRKVTADEAMRVAETVRRRSEETRIVGVFVNEEPETIRDVAKRVGLDMIQFHGTEPAEVISKVGLPAIRAYRVSGALPEIDPALGAEWILYDTWVPDANGGTGRRFDWNLLSAHPRNRRFFLSGGLTAENVREAIETAQPDAVDVSSGVEDAPGIKNHEKIQQLIRQVKG